MTDFDITLLTELRYPDLTPDDRQLRGALEARGARVRAAIWNDPSVDWSRSKLTVFRSTWDYFHHYDEFVAWLDRVDTQTQLVNEPSTIRWNMHKAYLADLERDGVRIVPTLFAQRGETLDLARIMTERGWSDVVIKPCVGGSATGAKRFDLTTHLVEARDHLAALTTKREAMVQPYLPSVETECERSLIFFNGTYSHALRKPAFTTLGVEQPVHAHEPTDQEHAIAREILATLEAMPVYARVDLVPAEGTYLLMELELIEPAFYFRVAPPEAVDRFAEVIVQALHAPVPAATA